MKRKFKIGLIIILLVAILSLLVYSCIKLTKSDDKQEVEKLDNIPSYGYSLDKRDTKLMKDEFKELKKVLSSEDVNYEDYAKSLSKLFVIDLFTIENKINKYDVPCLEYILEDNIDNFSNNVSDTLYKYVIDNTNKKRNQELPQVSSVIVENVEVLESSYKDEPYDGYKVNVEWTYLKDLGYDTSGIIKLIKKNNKLYVIGYETSEVTDEANN